MKIFLFCILAVTIGSAVAADVKEYPNVLIKIKPKSTTQIDQLQKAIREGFQGSHSLAPKIITPLSVGKSTYAVVPLKGLEAFQALLKRRHITYISIDSTNIRDLTVDNSMHAPSVFPENLDSVYVIESPRVTNWGEWGDWVSCPAGQYAKGIRLRTQFTEGITDVTALNAIVLLCATQGSQNYTNIHSLQGPSGSSGVLSICPDYSNVRGFQLRSEENQGAGDDTAANNLRIICDTTGDNVVQGDGMDWGSWTARQECLPRQAVCGFRTQVQSPQGSGDDTALNNVDMICCDVPAQQSQAGYYSEGSGRHSVRNNDTRSASGYGLSSSGEITLYSGTNFQGNSIVVSVTSGCSNVPASFNDKTNSVELGSVQCVILYQDYNCGKRIVQVNSLNQESLSDLSNFQLGGMLSAFAGCDETGTCTAEGYFPAPGNCNAFFRCVGSDGSFVRYDFTCPPGQYFDQANAACNLPDQIVPPRTDC